MENDSTPLFEPLEYSEDTFVQEPKKSTIEFLKQFARAYSFQQDLPLNLGGFIAN